MKTEPLVAWSAVVEGKHFEHKWEDDAERRPENQNLVEWETECTHDL